MLALTLALLLAGSFGVYRYLNSLGYLMPSVDVPALDARVRAALPPGSTEAQVVAWLRAESFPDDRIRLTRYRGAGGQLLFIDAWIPQRLFLSGYKTVAVHCRFVQGATEQCWAVRDGDFQPIPEGGSLETVPPPAAP